MTNTTTKKAKQTTTNVHIAWEPQPGPQTAFLRCPCFEIFYGGARGGGKSDAVLGEWVVHADKYGRDAIGLCIRRELTQLKELIERSKDIYSKLGAEWKEADKMWRFPNGARLTFAYLENDTDAERYQGHSYSRVYVEELGNFPNPEPIFKLMATLRSANPKVRVGFRATGNPGGPGHLWIKRRYIDPAPRGGKVLWEQFENPFTGSVQQMDRVFISAKVTDNKYTNNDAYIAQLSMSGGPRLVEAWLHGNWSIIEGAFFDEWDPSVHVIPQFVVPQWWTRFVSMDWGSAHPCSIGWWAIVPDRYELDAPIQFSKTKYQYRNDLPRGAMVRYRELYLSEAHNNKGLKLTAEEVAERICFAERKEAKTHEGRPRIAYRVAGLDLFKEDGGPSLAERMGKPPYYLYWQKADNARTSRKGAMGGWDQMRQRLKGDVDGFPMLYVFENCVDAIRTIPAMQHDKDNIEDVDTDGEDHCPDEIRYACMSRPFSRQIDAPRKGRVFSVGPDNTVQINDVLDTGYYDSRPKVEGFKRIS